MNKIKLLSLGALMVTAMYANAQTTAHTKPTGYVTHTLKAGQFNLIGLTLHNPVVASGDIQGFTGGTQITDNDINFANVLTAGKTYILEITDAADTSLNGTIQEVTVWGANTFDTPQDLQAEGLAVGDKYQLRACKTISSVFGITAEGLLSGTSTTADIIWVPIGGGGFDKYFYHPGGGLLGAEGWKKVGAGSAEQADAPFTYTDAVFVQRRGLTDTAIVTTGVVKTAVTSVAVTDTYNFVSVVYPAGSTLGNSGFSSSLLHGTSTTADIIWVPIGGGGYEKYFYHPGGGLLGVAGWKKVGGGSADTSGDTLSSGMIIQRRSPTPYNAKINVPDTWDVE